MTTQQAARGQLPLNQIDKLPPRQRRWSMEVQAALGLKSLLGQNQILASSIAVATRIAETKPTAAGLAAKYPGVTAMDPFSSVVDHLSSYEALQQPSVLDRGILQSAVEMALDQSMPEAQHDDCVALRTCLRSEELLDEITALGTPPWDGAKGMMAAAAKVELDLLSIPPDRRTAMPFSGSLNATFWINRTDGTGADKKSFLCKTPTTTDDKVEGIRAGGEVAREAMAGRTATLLKGQLGLSLDMPETHVIKLDQSFLPATYRDKSGKPVTCSVQEVRENKGELRSQGDAMAAVPADQCAAMAILDLVTLNTDRHGGNILVGLDGGLVPIDQGASFLDASENGIGRISETMAGPQNALLKLPGSHKPMDPALRKRLMAIDPTEIGKKLTDERDTIEAGAPDMAGKITDQSIAMSRRAAEFLKIAAGVEVDGRTLSPAAIQVAFGANAKELLGAVGAKKTTAGDGFVLSYSDFLKRSEEIAQKALQDMPLIEAVCTMSEAEHRMIGAQMQKKGWDINVPGDAPLARITDPTTLLRVLASGEEPDDDPNIPMLASAAKVAARNKNSPASLISALTEARLQAATDLAKLLPPGQSATTMQQLRANAASFRANPATLGKLSAQIEAAIIKDTNDEMARLDREYALSPTALDWARRYIGTYRFKEANAAIAKVNADAKAGVYPARQATATQGGTNG